MPSQTDCVTNGCDFYADKRPCFQVCEAIVNRFSVDWIQNVAKQRAERVCDVILLEGDPSVAFIALTTTLHKNRLEAMKTAQSKHVVRNKLTTRDLATKAKYFAATMRYRGGGGGQGGISFPWKSGLWSFLVGGWYLLGGKPKVLSSLLDLQYYFAPFPKAAK